MLRTSLIAIIGTALITSTAFAETATGAVRGGNELYQEGDYEGALKKYKDAQVESPSDERIMFNLGNAQYKMGQYEEALGEHLRSAQIDDPVLKARSHYNAGNDLYRAGKLEDAVEQYLKALQIDPSDEDAKFNLEFVRREIKRRNQEQQQHRQEQQEQKKNEQKQQNEKNQDQNSGEKKDDKSESGKKNEPQEPKQQQQKKNQQDNDGKEPDTPPEIKQPGQPQGTGQQQDKQHMSPGEMSDENMERWLNAVEDDTAENMNEFLKKQQPGEITVYRKDW
jgi:Ca-activated chloride channel family protein